MIAIIILGLIIADFAKAKFPKADLPNILFISAIAILVGIPNLSPLATFMKTEFAKIGLLPLCTPILSYAGISIGKDLPAFKKQGVAIVTVALLTFLGTYIGSAVIAEVVLKLTGQI
jgi:NhaP-type Na+/H+ or K+/H+ antiporter